MAECVQTVVFALAVYKRRQQHGIKHWIIKAMADSSLVPSKKSYIEGGVVGYKYGAFDELMKFAADLVHCWSRGDHAVSNTMHNT